MVYRTERPPPPSWARRELESSRAFALFRAYRDMHPLDRSLAQVGEKSGRSVKFVERLSARFQWLERAAAYDDEQDRLQQARRVRDIEEMNARHAAVAVTAVMRVAQRLETIDPEVLKAGELARLLEIATRAERMARGVLPDEPTVQHRGPLITAEEIRRALASVGALPE